MDDMMKLEHIICFSKTLYVQRIILQNHDIMQTESSQSRQITLIYINTDSNHTQKQSLKEKGGAPGGQRRRGRQSLLSSPMIQL